MDETRQLPIDNQGNVTITLLPGVREKLVPIRDHLMFVVTNQAGIKRGRLTAEKVEAAIVALDLKLGEILTGWQVCPHTDDDRCECRKPKGGMIRDLAEMFGVDLKASAMIGDQDVDRQAGEAAGVAEFIWANDFFDSK
jgi:histidinol-phosphate phosphatase family protein